MASLVTKETTVITPKNASVEEAKADKSQTASYIIYFIFGLVEVLLIFRLILKLTGANPLSGFVDFIYSLTQIFVVPFTGIFPLTTSTGAVTTAVLEPATIVAMVVYAVLAWGITEIVHIMSRKPQ